MQSTISLSVVMFRLYFPSTAVSLDVWQSQIENVYNDRTSSPNFWQSTTQLRECTCSSFAQRKGQVAQMIHVT